MGRIYSIQEHDATRKHWDLRLEMGGVLKSWAIPKEPSKDPMVKRLAIQVDNHDKDYAFFEGEIPGGRYGAGTVKLYDRGTYEMVDEKPGRKYVIDIKGSKLKGKFVLLRFPKGGGKEWLFFKKKE
ncbi:MAG: ATP-dependent DNA ligase [Candidatus Aenigmatarchaeota archaeon]|nr:MAG: ATP-dependent DNA ligase [Candidatus Aenigmarchaeota archaeon]